MDCSLSGGFSQMPWPMMRMTPKPMRLTVRSAPILIVPADVADGLVSKIRFPSVAGSEESLLRCTLSGSGWASD